MTSLSSSSLTFQASLLMMMAPIDAPSSSKAALSDRSDLTSLERLGGGSPPRDLSSASRSSSSSLYPCGALA